MKKGQQTINTTIQLPYISYPDKPIDPLTIILLPKEYFNKVNKPYKIIYRAYNVSIDLIDINTYKDMLTDNKQHYADGNTIEEAIRKLKSIL